MALTPERRARKIASYGGAYERLVAGLGGFPPEMWDFRDEHGCWSIREHLIHIADREANSYIRCRRLIAEPGRALMAYDENGAGPRPWGTPRGARRMRWSCSARCGGRVTL